MVNRRFGRLKCLAATIQYKGPHQLYLCACKCDGKLVLVQGNNLRSGHTTSCGCLQNKARKVDLKVTS
jgi:hypothetical protein